MNRTFRKWRAVTLAAVWIGLTATVIQAQVPGAGGAGAGAAAAPAAGGATAAPAAGAAAPGAAGAAQGGFLTKFCAFLDECKRKCCATPCGQMINSMIMPAAAFTGGVIPGFCPTTPSQKELEEEGVGGAAAAAKKEAAEAKARRAAVAFLGTVDCRYFPGTAQTLATALRVDSSECVRFEAALVLGRGCCCSEVTIKALEASVSGMEIDGNPAERSCRVRLAAAIALEKCLGCYSPPYQEPEPKKIIGEETPTPGEVDPKVKPKPDTLPAPKPVEPPTLKLERQPAKKETVERARKVLAEFQAMLSTAGGGMPNPPPGAVAGRKGLFHLIKDTEFEGPVVYAPLESTSEAKMSDTASIPAPVTPAAPVKPALSIPTSVMAERAATLAAPKSESPALVPVTIPVATPAVQAPTKVSTVPAPVALTPPKPVVAAPTFTAPVAPTITAPVAPTITAPVAPVAPTITYQVPPSTRLSAPPAVLVPDLSKSSSAIPPTAPAATAPALPETAPVSKFVPAAATFTKAANTEDVVVDWCKRVLEGATPAERHAAIRQVVQFKWLDHPVIASTLLAGAKEDSSSIVRVDCIRHLVAYRMNHPQVITELAKMSTESDSWVRGEATKAAEQLKQVK